MTDQQQTERTTHRYAITFESGDQVMNETDLKDELDEFWVFGPDLQRRDTHNRFFVEADEGFGEAYLEETELDGTEIEVLERDV